MPFEGSDQRGSFAGVPLHWHGTLVLIPLYLALQFPRFGLVTASLLVVVLTIALVVSILLHEAAHVWTARRFGIGAQAILLHGFGGFALLDHVGFRTPQRIAISLAGPLMNFALALAGLALFRCVAFLASGPDSLPLGEGTWFPTSFVRDGPVWLNPVLAGLRTFTTLNVLLGALNLLPGFPLDGGMIVQALLEHVAKPLAAVRMTAVLGLIVGGWVCTAAGLIGFGAIVLGLLLVAINGWALKNPQDFA